MDASSFLVGVLSSVVAAVLVGVVARSRGWFSFSWRSLTRSVMLQRRIEASGITNFYASRDDFAKYRGAPRLLDYLTLANNSIRIAAYWMAHGVEMEGIAQGLAAMTKPPKRLNITIAIIDPTAPYISALASYLDMDPDELRARARSSLLKLWQARQGLAEDERARLHLKVCTTSPIASVIMLDPEEPDGRLQIDVKAYKTPRNFSFAFELRHEDHYLYRLCRDAWIRLLLEAEDFNPELHINAPND